MIGQDVQRLCRFLRGCYEAHEDDTQVSGSFLLALQKAEAIFGDVATWNNDFWSAQPNVAQLAEDAQLTYPPNPSA